jgi:hypothetical protein
VNEQDASWESTSVAAVLAQRNGEDLATLLEDLAGLLSNVVPNAKVERTLFRRRVRAVRIPLGDTVYLLRRGSDGRFETFRQQAVRGVVIRTDPMPLEEFLAELGAAIDSELRRSEHGHEVLKTWLDTIR